MQHDNFEKDILKQLKRVAESLEKIEKKIPIEPGKTYWIGENGPTIVNTCDSKCKTIMLCFNRIMDKATFFNFIVDKLHKEAKDEYYRIDKFRGIIRYKDYYIKFCPADKNRIAGMICDYYWSDNIDCMFYLEQSYHGHEKYAKLHNPYKVVDILGLEGGSDD